MNNPSSDILPNHMYHVEGLDNYFTSIQNMQYNNHVCFCVIMHIEFYSFSIIQDEFRTMGP